MCLVVWSKKVELRIGRECCRQLPISTRASTKYFPALMMGASFGAVEGVGADGGGACGGSRAAVLIDGSTHAIATPVRSG